MAVQPRPPVEPNSWAETAGIADLVRPSQGEIDSGWPDVDDPPPRQYFNWLQNWMFRAGLYFLQRGIPEWAGTEQYALHSRVQRNGLTYTCVNATGVTGRDPADPTNSGFWRRWGYSSADVATSSAAGLMSPAQLQGLPVAGDTMWSFNSSERAGWLLMSGQAVSRTTYAALFSIFGTSFGAGNGTTTFNIPDCRGLHPRMVDLGRGFDPGRAPWSYQADDIKSHSHAVNLQPLNSNSTSGWGKIATGNEPPEGTMNPLTTNLTGITENRVKTIAMYWFVKT